MTGFPRLQLDRLKEPLVLQGWFPPQAEVLAAGLAEAGDSVSCESLLSPIYRSWKRVWKPWPP